MEKWDERFIDLSRLVASWSKDTSRKCACVIVDSNRSILSVGYNGFPRGVDDSIETRYERPDKYLWTEHGERNAIYNAARNGIRLEGATIYMSWHPCAECTRAIIQSGIKTLVCGKSDHSDPKYGHEFQIAEVMLLEAGLEVRILDELEVPKQR